MFNKHDLSRNECMLTGKFKKQGYDWWWHNFTATNEKTGERRAFFIEYFVCNSALGGAEPVFGQLPENNKKGVKPSYLMVKCGTWGENATQLHRFFGWDNVSIGKKPYSVSAGDCFASDTALKGSVGVSKEGADAHPEYMSDSGSMSWDLTVEKLVAFNVGYGASAPLRAIKAFEMYWHAEGMKTAFEGTVTFGGERYIVKKEDCFGYSDKNWGSDFTSPWVWLSSCNLTSNLTGKKLNNSVFDIGGGKPKIFFLPLNRKLLSAFWYEGKCYEFNFSKFWTFTRTKFHCYETDDEVVWHVEQKTWTNKMITDITCKKKDMLLVNYESPNGKKLHNRLYNGGTGTGRIQLFHRGKLVDDILAENIGCEYGEYGDGTNKYE